MRIVSSIVSLLLVTTICSTSLSAQDNYRIKRSGSSGSSSESSFPSGQSDYSASTNGTTKPLTGVIEHRASPIDPDQYQAPMNGRADSTSLSAGANSMQMRAAVANTPLLPGGINSRSNPLQSGLPNYNQMTPAFPLSTIRTRLPSDLSDSELKLLRSRDIVIMQDRSSSMGDSENYPQGYFPRWYWCLSQAMDFRRQTLRIADWVFTLVLFSSKFDVYRNVSMEQLPTIFDRNHIWIGTHLAPPMAEQLNEYFQRRAQGRARPLLIAVVTDGKPKDESALEEVIIDATQHLQSPTEVHITFLQVGTDDESYRKLGRLDNQLVARGARYDIVSVMPFNQVTRLGLSKSLVTAVLNAGRQ